VIEILIAAAVLASCCATGVALAVQAARRRSRIRAERVLDALAAEACAALALDDGSRRTARALERYDRAQERLAAARTWRELEAAVARDRLRLAAWDLAARGAVRVQAALAANAAARRASS
jgi:hypothetical protein